MQVKALVYHLKILFVIYSVFKSISREINSSIKCKELMIHTLILYFKCRRVLNGI